MWWKQFSRTRLKRHWFMRYSVYNVRYSLKPINSTLLTVILRSFTLTQYNFHGVITEFVRIFTRNVCKFLPDNTYNNTHDSILNRFLHGCKGSSLKLSSSVFSLLHRSYNVRVSNPQVTWCLLKYNYTERRSFRDENTASPIFALHSTGFTSNWLK